MISDDLSWSELASKEFIPKGQKGREGEQEACEDQFSQACGANDFLFHGVLKLSIIPRNPLQSPLAV